MADDEIEVFDNQKMQRDQAASVSHSIDVNTVIPQDTSLIIVGPLEINNCTLILKDNARLCIL
jgi:hypothetical protein